MRIKNFKIFMKKLFKLLTDVPIPTPKKKKKISSKVDFFHTDQCIFNTYESIGIYYSFVLDVQWNIY